MDFKSALLKRECRGLFVENVLFVVRTANNQSNDITKTNRTKFILQASMRGPLWSDPGVFSLQRLVPCRRRIK